MKEIMVKIIKSYPVAERGSYRIVDVIVEEISTKKQYKVGVFIDEGEWSFENGDEVLMAIKQGKLYKGSPTYSSNVSSISKSGTQKESILSAYDKIVKPKEVEKEKELIKEVIDEQKMWAAKERRDHKRALTMQAFGLFVPRSNEDETTPMDRWMEIRDMRDIMLTDLYND
jgi:hypothetical protein